MSEPRVIAIDGAAGSGKSTLARGLAAALGLPYVNTGSMYRALTAAALSSGVAADDEQGLVDLIGELRFTVGGDTIHDLEVEGYDDAALTALDVEANVSAVARHPPVRAGLRAIQRRIGEAHGAVMEGRDIASVVFPDAPVKLYLVAGASVRLRRRQRQRAADPGVVAESMRSRDARDARINPFEAAEDAAIIDTTDRDEASTLSAAMEVVRRRAPELVGERGR
jgi:CMP/dCMP kinase